MKTFKTILFYILSFTWGILMSFVGCLVFLVLMIAGKKPEKFHTRFYIRVGRRWGGLELGPWFITDETPAYETLQHEAGHGFQNIVLGPLFPFVVGLPSAARYWLYEIKKDNHKIMYCFTIELLLVLIGCAFLIPGILFSKLWAIIIGAFVLAFMLYMLVFLCIIELPKFLNGKSPEYDSAWFEGQATRLGKKYYPETK